MATFLLIHGMWHGGWCWKKVTPLLRESGHEVHVATLTGVGERAHLRLTQTVRRQICSLLKSSMKQKGQKL